MASSYNFNNDVLFEIFSRADLKTMTKCRVVSKECKYLTYNSNFMKLHSHRTRTMLGYLLHSQSFWGCSSLFLSVDNPSLGPELNPYFLKFLPESKPVQILATAKEGLVFCSSNVSYDRFYICKPSIAEWEVVPRPNPLFFWTRMTVVVLGSNPLWFKIIRISYDCVRHNFDLESEYSTEDFDCFTYKKFKCEIFDSRRWEWKQSDDLILSRHEYFSGNKPAVSARGGLHCLTNNLGQIHILSFCGYKENWEIQSLPESISRRENNYSTLNLAEYEGSLALICYIKDIKVVDVWVLRDYFHQTWIKKHTVNLSNLTQEIVHNDVVSLYNADTLFIIGAWSAVFYDLNSGGFNRIKLPSEHETPKSIHFIHTDYEPVQLRPRKIRWDCWEPPMSNRLKFNVDAWVNGSTGEAGCGGVLRNWNGDILATFSGPCEELRDSTLSGPCEELRDSCLAELMAIKAALECFSKSKWFKEAGVIIESSSKEAILLCTGSAMYRSWRYIPVCSHIDVLVMDIGDVSFSFAFREANAEAVSLAKAGACRPNFYSVFSYL